jgi:hypothetical protein
MKGLMSFLIRLMFLFAFILLVRYLEPIFNFRQSYGMQLVIVAVWLILAVWVFLGGKRD